MQSVTRLPVTKGIFRYMAITPVLYYQDMTHLGMGYLTVSRFWGEQWFSSYSAIRNDLIHHFGADFKLVDMADLDDAQLKELEAFHASL